MTETIIETKISPLMMDAQRMEIHTEEGLICAKQTVLDIRALRKEVEDTLDPVINKAHQAHKEALTAKKRHTAPLDEAERLIRGKMGEYYGQVARDKAAEEARLADEAQKALMKEEAAAERKIKKLREKGATGIEQLSILRGQLNDPDLSDAEERALRTEIKVIESQINRVADAIEEKKEEIDTKRFAPAPVVAAEPGPKGVSVRKTLIPEITSAITAIRAVADGTAPVSIIKFDLAAIKRLVNGGLKIPGVAAKEKSTVSIRG